MKKLYDQRIKIRQPFPISSTFFELWFENFDSYIWNIVSTLMGRARNMLDNCTLFAKLASIKLIGWSFVAFKNILIIKLFDDISMLILWPSAKSKWKYTHLRLNIRPLATPDSGSSQLASGSCSKKSQKSNERARSKLSKRTGFLARRPSINSRQVSEYDYKFVFTCWGCFNYSESSS